MPEYVTFETARIILRIPKAIFFDNPEASLNIFPELSDLTRAFDVHTKTPLQACQYVLTLKLKPITKHMMCLKCRKNLIAEDNELGWCDICLRAENDFQVQQQRRLRNATI